MQPNRLTHVQIQINADLDRLDLCRSDASELKSVVLEKQGRIQAAVRRRIRLHGAAAIRCRPSL